MKTTFTLLTVVFLTVSGLAQISPGLKAGVGYSHVLDKNEAVFPNYHTLTGYPTLSVEKPLPIEIRLKNRLSINPGIAYNMFNEKNLKGDTVNGHNFRLNHYSVNGFVKILFQAKFRGLTEAFVYGGGIGGINLITKSMGTKYVYGLNKEIPMFDNPINENARDFFEMFYYGAMIGFQPHARKYNIIKPSFELAYYPAFISKSIESAQQDFRDINTIQFTILLGIRTK